MGAKEDYIPISALQHYAFCPRQCGLIYIDKMWNESYLTAHGRLLHQRVHDESQSDIKDGVMVMRGLALVSHELKIFGEADIVEYRSDKLGAFNKPYPVEYKRGRSKVSNCDRVQLCAQAMCLEEMNSCIIPFGAIYYGQPRRRERVEFTSEIREETKSLCYDVHQLYINMIIPKPVYSKQCKSCSIYDLCQPRAINRKVKGYWRDILNDLDGERP